MGATRMAPILVKRKWNSALASSIIDKTLDANRTTTVAHTSLAKDADRFSVFRGLDPLWSEAREGI